MTDLVRSAMLFATAAHEAVGQRRKYTNAPYIMHPAAVVGILCNQTSRPPTDEMVAAAWLHDVVEDTQVKIESIEDFFGPKVRNLVYWLTDISKPKDGNRENRKAIDRAHIADAPAEAQTIKLADLIDNTESICRYDPDFAKVYLREKELLLGVLTKADPQLYERALEQLGDALRDLP